MFFDVCSVDVVYQCLFEWVVDFDCCVVVGGFVVVGGGLEFLVFSFVLGVYVLVGIDEVVGQFVFYLDQFEIVFSVCQQFYDVLSWKQ